MLVQIFEISYLPIFKCQVNTLYYVAFAYNNMTIIITYFFMQINTIVLFVENYNIIIIY